MLSKLEGGCFDRYMSFAAWRSDGGWTTMLWTSLGHLFFCCYSVTRSQHGNINSMLLSLKRRRSGCQQEWLLQLSTLLLLKKIYSRTHHKYWHVSLCAEQVWQKKRKKEKRIVDARLILYCLEPQHEQTLEPPLRAILILPAYFHLLKKNHYSAALKVMGWCINHGVQTVGSCTFKQGCSVTHADIGKAPSDCVQRLRAAATSCILCLMARGLTWSVIWKEWSQGAWVKRIPPVPHQTQQDSKSDR